MSKQPPEAVQEVLDLFYLRRQQATQYTRMAKIRTRSLPAHKAEAMGMKVANAYTTFFNTTQQFNAKLSKLTDAQKHQLADLIRQTDAA